MWAAHVKLEMTQDNERLTKCQAPNEYRGGPPILWQPVGREIKGAETHWCALSRLGAPLMTS